MLDNCYSNNQLIITTKNSINKPSKSCHIQYKSKNKNWTYFLRKAIKIRKFKSLIIFKWALTLSKTFVIVRAWDFLYSAGTYTLYTLLIFARQRNIQWSAWWENHIGAKVVSYPFIHSLQREVVLLHLHKEILATS